MAHLMHSFATTALLLVVASARVSTPPSGWVDDQPNPPAWPPSVVVFSPSDTHISATAAALTEGRSGGLALLFAPGVYRGVDVRARPSTTIMGLGKSARETVFRGGKGVLNGVHDAPTSFQSQRPPAWRSKRAAPSMWTAENFFADGTVVWGAGAGAGLRRVAVAGVLDLHNGTMETAGDSDGYQASCADRSEKSDVATDDCACQDDERSRPLPRAFAANVAVSGGLALGPRSQGLVRNADLGPGAAPGSVPGAVPGAAARRRSSVAPMPRLRCRAPRRKGAAIPTMAMAEKVVAEKTVAWVMTAP